MNDIEAATMVMCAGGSFVRLEFIAYFHLKRS